MEEGDKGRFVEIMRYLAVNFPDRRVDVGLCDSYFSDLSGLGIDDVGAAARAYVKVGDRFPFVSDLLRHAGKPDATLINCVPKIKERLRGQRKRG